MKTEYRFKSKERVVIIDKIPKLDDINLNGVILNDRDFHCIARLFQSVFFAPVSYYFYGCAYCKYAYECHVNQENKKFDISDFNMIRLMRNLGKITGVGTGPLSHPKMFYQMSIQELYPKKAKTLYEMLSPKSLKSIKKYERKFIRSFKKPPKWRQKLKKRKGLYKFESIRKFRLYINQKHINLYNKLSKIKSKFDKF